MWASTAALPVHSNPVLVCLGPHTLVTFVGQRATAHRGKQAVSEDGCPCVAPSSPCCLAGARVTQLEERI